MDAYCLLGTITWPEPFGLFMIEAMACGTPVIAFNKGSALEVVHHGETGFVVVTVREMVEAVDELSRIQPASCREYVQRHFDFPRMVDDYLSAYEHILMSRPADVATPSLAMAGHRPPGERRLMSFADVPKTPN